MKEMVSVEQVKNFTKRKLLFLIAQSKENTAVLAELRRGVGKIPGELPGLSGYFMEGMPEAFFGQAEPSRAEWAVYTALTLFALHQQGNAIDGELMYEEGSSIGKAISKLVKREEDRERIRRRFNSVATSNSIEEIAYYLRGIIQMLRNEKIGVDYVALSGDLYLFQFPELRPQVRLRWGQDYYGSLTKREEKDLIEEEEK